MTRILILGSPHRSLAAAIAAELINHGIAFVVTQADENSGVDMQLLRTSEWIDMDEAIRRFPVFEPIPYPTPSTGGKQKAQWKRERAGRRS